MAEKKAPEVSARSSHAGSTPGVPQTASPGVPNVQVSAPQGETVTERSAGSRAGSTVRWVEGVHNFQAREFGLQDWYRAGLVTEVEGNPPKLREGVRAVVFNQGNNFSVPAEQFDFLTDAEWSRFVEGDPGLEVVPGEPQD
jgi:hypothetical protein